MRLARRVHSKPMGRVARPNCGLRKAKPRDSSPPTSSRCFARGSGSDLAHGRIGGSRARALQRRRPLRRRRRHFSGGGVHVGGGGGYHASVHWGGGGYYHPHSWGVRGHIYVGGYHPYYYRPYYNYYYPVVPRTTARAYYPVEAEPRTRRPATTVAVVAQPELPRFGIGLFAGGVVDRLQHADQHVRRPTSASPRSLPPDAPASSSKASSARPRRRSTASTTSASIAASAAR